jgi:hypothetical protein
MFDNYADATAAVEALETAGVPHADISLMANERHRDAAGVAHTAAGDEAVKGAEGGAIVGAAGGLLAGLGIVAIPGLGPVVAAGWLVSTLAGLVGGAAVGAAAGGVVGAMTKAGVPEEDAHVYAEGVRRGGSVVSAQVADAQLADARRILKSDRTVDVAARRDAYRAEGWTKFDEKAPAYESESTRERELLDRP